MQDAEVGAAVFSPQNCCFYGEGRLTDLKLESRRVTFYNRHAGLCSDAVSAPGQQEILCSTIRDRGIGGH